MTSSGAKKGENIALDLACARLFVAISRKKARPSGDEMERKWRKARVSRLK